MTVVEELVVAVELLVGSHLLGDVLVGGDPSAVRHRLADDPPSVAVGGLDDLDRRLARPHPGDHVGGDPGASRSLWRLA